MLSPIKGKRDCNGEDDNDGEGALGKFTVDGRNDIDCDCDGAENKNVNGGGGGGDVGEYV